MTRKNFYIIIAVILGVFVIGLISYYFLIIQKGTSSTNGTSTGTQTFSPFGTSPIASSSTQTVQNQTQTIGTVQNQNYTAKLRQISNVPVAGFGLLDTKSGTIVRHIEVATGHIFETELFSPKQTRISNTTIPLVYNALWGNENNSLVTQTLSDNEETINSNVLSLKSLGTTTTTTEDGYTVSGFALAGGANDISVSDSNVFYLVESNLGSQGFLSNFTSPNRREVWNSPVREFLPQIINATTVDLTTKPYPNVNGFLYSVNTTNGRVTKILGNIVGLSDLISPDGSQVLYLSQTDTAEMSLYTVKTDKTTSISPTTFPEKCVWSKKNTSVVYCAVPRELVDGNSLTNWYMGEASFTDDIWKYDLKANTAIIVASPTDESGQKIDIEKPELSASEQYFVFMNKIDGTLWSVDLSQ